MLRKIFALTVLFLSACAPVSRPAQTGMDQTLELAGGTLGQTFVARYDGLMGVEIYARARAAARVAFALRAAPDGEVLARGEVWLEPFSDPLAVRLPFEPQPASHREGYYLSFESEVPGPVEVRAGRGEAYLDGAAYQNEEPLPDAQLAFRLVYHPGWLAWGLMKEGLFWLGMLGAAVVLFVLPGWALLRALLPGWGARAWLEKLALSAGASLAVYPLLMLWTDLVGVRLGAWYAWLPPLGGFSYLLWVESSSGAQERAAEAGKWRLLTARIRSWFVASPSLLADLVFLLLLGLLVFSRFWVIRNLEGPMWGDGMQHTMITQLLLDHGGLFDSWAPYAPMQTFTYHFGFHAAAAAFAWLTGLEARFATLWAGQIFNVLAVLAVYPLACKIGGSRWAGVGAVLVAGLLVQMPMFYVNWGRYTQLAGQVILPAALFLAWEALDEPRRLSWQGAALGGVLWAGLGLTHYRVLIMGILGLAAFGLIHFQQHPWRRLGGWALALGVAGAALFLPWLAQAYAGRLMDILHRQLQSWPATNNSAAQVAAVTGDLASYLPPWVWMAIPAGLGLALWRRRPWAHAFGLWWVLLAGAAYPHWLGLPGGAIVGFFTVFIAAYMLAGVALGHLLSGVEGGPGWQLAALAVGLLLAGVWGTRARIGEVRPLEHAMLTRPDLRAAAWVEQNIPAEAVFLIDGFTAYNGYVAVGADGGWWLPVLTGRAVSHPPLLFEFEAEPAPNFRQSLVELTNTVREYGAAAPETLAALGGWGVTHVYIGQQQGRVNSPGPALRPEALLASEFFRLVYHQDRVWIFEVRR